MTEQLYCADIALVDGVMREGVTLSIDDRGFLTRVGGEGGDRLAGIVVPGMPNLHSHAFQRAMAGLAETAGPGGDSFWTWRETMYRFLGILTPDDVEAIAAWLYVECLKHGYTTIGEFHYLHNTPDGRPYADIAELSNRILAAADQSGVGLTLLPVLYQASQFGGAPPTEGQRRFTMDDERFGQLMQTMSAALKGKPGRRLGVAPHSLRAVTPDALTRLLERVDTLDPSMPRHIHAAEQTREVADSIAFCGKRPVETLLDRGLDARWCLIHATHMTSEERERLALSGAVAGLCPTTEANLGDGFFPIAEFLAEGGAFGIGTDSNVATSPVEELRWLEYGARLLARARNVAMPMPGISSGAALVGAALKGGAQALGQSIGEIAVGKRADLVILDPDHPALVGKPLERCLDGWIFGGNDTPVRDVMVGGRVVVKDRVHWDEARLRARFSRTMTNLRAKL